MADDLLTYYERELTFLRQSGAEFAAKYPKIANRLLLEADKSEDPHVERLVQAFSFLAARIHHKLDDEFPEITDALLGVLYPHYLAPVPSMSVVQFVLDPTRGKVTSGHRIERGAVLYSQSVGGAPCRFRTCYPLTLWPIEVASAQFTAPDRVGMTNAVAAALRLELRSVGETAFPELAIDQLRVFLHGESSLVYGLYELLFNDTVEIHLRPLSPQKGSKPIVLTSAHLGQVGFGPDEGMLPYSARSFMGYRLLQEYFTFPEKFHFFDLRGLSRATGLAFKDGVEILIGFKRVPRLEQSIDAATFRLGCTPIVNLFSQIAEPIRLSHAQAEYRVIPDVRRPLATEVYSIDSVISTAANQDSVVEFQPFYSFKHAVDRERQSAFWHATRRASEHKGDDGTEVFLSIVDLNFQPTLPAIETLTIHTTCTNRDLPGKLPFGGDAGDFELEGAAPLSRIRCLRKPTETVRAPLRRGGRWSLISHLSLNYLSMSEGGREALQEILKLYDFSDAAVVRQQIAGIIDVRSRRIVSRPRSMPWNAFCRGLEVTIELDEQKYVGSGVFLFACVLEKFLGLYSALNSFSQLIVRTRQREEPLRRWQPRTGEQILL